MKTYTGASCLGVPDDQTAGVKQEALQALVHRGEWPKVVDLHVIGNSEISKCSPGTPYTPKKVCVIWTLSGTNYPIRKKKNDPSLLRPPRFMRSP